MQLRQVGVANNMVGMNKPEVYIQQGKQKFNEQDELIDGSTREHYKKFLEAFYQWTINLKSSN